MFAILKSLVNDDKFILLVASSLVGIVSFLIKLFIDIRDKRSHIYQRTVTLEYVNKRVSFLKDWYNLQKEVTENNSEEMEEIKDKVRQSLDSAYDDLAYALIESEKLLQEHQEQLARFNNTNRFTRFFLLYTPYNTAGRLFHMLYFMCLFPLIMWIGLEVTNYSKDANFHIDNTSLLIGILLVVLVPTFQLFGRRTARPFEQDLKKYDEITRPRDKLQPSPK